MLTFESPFVHVVDKIRFHFAVCLSNESDSVDKLFCNVTENRQIVFNVLGLEEGLLGLGPYEWFKVLYGLWLLTNLSIQKKN